VSIHGLSCRPGVLLTHAVVVSSPGLPVRAVVPMVGPRVAAATGEALHTSACRPGALVVRRRGATGHFCGPLGGVARSRARMRSDWRCELVHRKFVTIKWLTCVIIGPDSQPRCRGPARSRGAALGSERLLRCSVSDGGIHVDYLLPRWGPRPPGRLGQARAGRWSGAAWTLVRAGIRAWGSMTAAQGTASIVSVWNPCARTDLQPMNWPAAGSLGRAAPRV
jgi:hypothetical protein